MKTLRLSAYALCVPFLVACGGSDDESPSDDTTVGNGDPVETPMVEELACDPNGEIPCIENIAEPCEGIESGYPGDEYCRAVPDPAYGFQTHVGPSDYSNPDEVASYIIFPGEETNWAEVVQGENDETMYTRGYWSYMRPGSHHFIMYGVDQDPTNGMRTDTSGGGLESAVGIGGRFLGGATRQIQNITLESDYPEDQGIGHEVPPRAYAAMNLHFVNVGEEALIQEIWVNMIKIDEADVTQYIKPITWYGGVGMNIPPGTEQTLTNAGQTECRPPPGSDFRIAMMTAHAHANTVRVSAFMNDRSTHLYTDYDWAEPTEWRFTRAQQNSDPDEATLTGGGFNGLLQVTDQDTFTWECEVHNQTNVNLTFGNRVYDGEMCMTFGFYIDDVPHQPPFACAFF